jgi:RNA polymerase sigma-70 factor (ECF subfamily)
MCDPKSGFGSDEDLLAALRAGDERAFVELVDAHGAAMRRFACDSCVSPPWRMTWCRTRGWPCSEVWIVLRGVPRWRRGCFRSFRTSRKPRRFGRHERCRCRRFESEAADDERAVAVDRFFGPDGAYPGGWLAFPLAWSERPEVKLEAAETRAVISAAIDVLPPAQRVVISLRDVEGWPATEVCNVLEISETNQRVLLHRARSKVRGALERYFEDERL